MVNVKKKCCGKCLFTANKIVSDDRKSELVKSCLANDTHFICHETKDAVCKGFYGKYTSQAVRIAQRLGGIVMVD